MKITSGLLKGRVLRGLIPDGVRPTSEKVRQALFNILGNDLSGLSFLDLFCGSGINGLEAVSRGIENVCWVDSNKKCIEQIKKQVKHFDLQDRVALSFVIEDLYNSSLNKIGSLFDIIFLDPPYIYGNSYRDGDEHLLTRLIKNIIEKKVLASNGIIVFETSKRFETQFDSRLKLKKIKKYKDSLLQFWINE